MLYVTQLSIRDIFHVNNSIANALFRHTVINYTLNTDMTLEKKATTLNKVPKDAFRWRMDNLPAKLD